MKTTEFLVLAIDDDEVDRRKVRRLIGQEMSLVEAENGEDALTQVARRRPDCILLDFRIPGTDSLELLASFADDFLPVVMLTGEGSERIAVEVMKRGAQDYLSKQTLSKEGLIRAITNAVEKISLERKIYEKQKELEDFVSIAAHDFKSPLMSIAGAVDSLRENCRGAGASAADDLDILQDRVQHLQRFIQELLDYTRSGRSDKALETIDFQELVEYVVSLLEIPIANSGATIEIEKLPNVRGDWTALLQLVQNLLANAIKFRADTAPHIRISAIRQSHQCLVAIADNGIGIDSKHHSSIFAPLRRLHGESDYEGNGLGLAACAKIVHQHHGRIWVESEPGKGATFYFTLPAAPDA